MEQIDTVWTTENATDKVASDQRQLHTAGDFADVVPGRSDHKQGTPIQELASKCSSHGVVQLGDEGWMGMHVVDGGSMWINFACCVDIVEVQSVVNCVWYALRAHVKLCSKHKQIDVKCNTCVYYAVARHTAGKSVVGWLVYECQGVWDASVLVAMFSSAAGLINHHEKS